MLTFCDETLISGKCQLGIFHCRSKSQILTRLDCRQHSQYGYVARPYCEQALGVSELLKAFCLNTSQADKNFTFPFPK
jgi:hypothetical protein